MDPFHMKFGLMGETTEIDIFEPGQIIRARIDLGDKMLPLRLKIRSKKSHYQEDFEKKLPEDLRIYIS